MFSIRNNSTCPKPKVKIDEEIKKALEETSNDASTSEDESSDEDIKKSDDKVIKKVFIPSEELKESKISRSKLSNLSEKERYERYKNQMKSWESKNHAHAKSYRQKYYAEHREEILAKRRLKRLEEKKMIEAFKQSQHK